MPTHTATITNLTRDSTRRLITLVLDHNPTLTAVLTYRQAAQLPFWLKPGQYIEKARHFSGTGLLFLTLNSPSTHQ